MHDVTARIKEKELREKVAARPEAADDYLELASLLFETRGFEEAVETLRQALDVPLGDVTRAVLRTALGWYVNAVTGGRDEPRSLGEQAVALTEGIETCEALVARAKAQALVADCLWLDDPARAAEIAASALSLLGRVLDADNLPKSIDLYEVLLESARVNCLMGRFEEASRRCEQALRAASDRDQELNSLIELGTIYREAGRLTEARETLTRAIRFQDVAPFGLVRPYFELGLTERALGKTPEARAKVRKAIDILQSDPSFPRGQLPEFLRVHGYISYDLEDIQEAARSFQAAVDSYAVTDPFHWDSLIWLARCQWDLGLFKTARMNAALVKQSPFASDQDRADADYLLQEIKV